MERYEIVVDDEGNYCGLIPSENGSVVKYADAQATVEALQAQYSELLEALDCVLAERPLPSGEYVHRVSCSGDRRKPAGTVGISCSCRVGQQQVAALQAQVKELEQWVQDQSTANLETMRHMDEMQSRAMDAEYQLTRRTAELEAVSNFIGVKYDAESKTWVSGQAPYLSAGTTKQEACIAAVDALRLACATWETKYRDLQAELERVRGLVKTYADAKIDFDDKRLQEDLHAWRERYTRLVGAETILIALTATSQPVPPYKEWCRHPEKCAGLASCPQDPTCAD